MRRLAFLPLVLAAAVACTEPAEPEDGKPAGSIRVQVSGEREETAVYRAMERAFENQEAAEVDLVEVADKDDHLARLTTSFAAGDPPDVFLVNYREYAQFVTRGAIEPAGAHLTEMGADRADYYEQPLEAFTFDGELQCMPQNISSLVVYYNRALFADAGLEHPPAGWTWEEFRRYARALTRGDVRGVGIDPEIIRIAPFVWSNGGDVVDDFASPTRFTLDEPAAREALEFVVSLVRDDGVVPTEEEVAAQDLETRFTTSKLGMLLSSRRDTPVFREVRGLDWDVAPLPVAEQAAGILHSDAYCVAASSENMAAAFRFVSFAVGREGETIAALGGRTVPSLIDVSRSGAFLDPTQPPRHSRVFLQGIPSIRRTPVIATWPEIEDVAAEILTRAFYEEGYTIDDALRDLESQTSSLFAEAAGS